MMSSSGAVVVKSTRLTIFFLSFRGNMIIKILTIIPTKATMRSDIDKILIV